MSFYEFASTNPLLTFFLFGFVSITLVGIADCFRK